jgi:hypothetical protein
MLLLDQALGFGCDPNVSVCADQSECTCRQTKWENWLHEEYLYSEQRSRTARRGDRTHQSIHPAKDVACHRIQANGSIVDLLLRHCADPNCTPCTADHQFEGTCSPAALIDVLQFIVPRERLPPLRTLLEACSSGDRGLKLRRNQRKRAIRSCINSEQRFASQVINRCPQTLGEDKREDWAERRWGWWREVQIPFLKTIMFTDSIVECETWKADEEFTGLLTWCLDCGSRSHACVSCPRAHSLTKDAACTSLLNSGITRPEGHTTVAALFDILPLPADGESRWQFTYEDPWDDDPASLNSAYQSLGCGPGEMDLTSKAVISVLK